MNKIKKLSKISVGETGSILDTVPDVIRTSVNFNYRSVQDIKGVDFGVTLDNFWGKVGQESGLEGEEPITFYNLKTNYMLHLPNFVCGIIALIFISEN
ncbi:hypothetical protein OUZ56_032081 [Daphnia magna]|uniref:Uncharacterized protein n=1 Tax=Daphnia magna TaxID=35525 RepID=A0ABQ9ZW40_9CRUS|nr:hypothetical protein OUZ56_032081 [Daphnia magna]